MDNITSKMSHLLAIFIKPTVTSVNILYVLYEFIGVTLDIENLHTKQRKATSDAAAGSQSSLNLELNPENKSPYAQKTYEV